MPWGDGTGPWWGRGNWMCRRGFGMGYGAGPGRGRYRAAGYGYAPYGAYQQYSPAAPSANEETAQLREYVAGLEAEMKEAKKRLSELEAKK